MTGSTPHTHAASRYSRSPIVSLVLALVTIAAGLTIRFVHLGLPAVLVKYGGSALWAVMIYVVVSAILGSRRVVWSATLSAVLATAIEFFKLYYVPWLDAFRRTLPGIVLLGRVFSFRDIAVYWLAIALVAVLDLWFLRHPDDRQS